MLKRKMLSTLVQWAQNQTAKAFLLVGARQTGKTYVVRQFAQQHFKTLAEVNLLEQKDAKDLLLSADNTEDFLTRLSLLTGTQVDPENTLIFLDEIQEAPDLLTVLKFLVEDGRCRVVISGSLLGTELKGIRSFPVGYVEIHRMFPLDFEEFCWSQQVPQAIIEDIREAYHVRKGLDQPLHDQLLRLYRYHLAVGGMPEVVARFVASDNDILTARQTATEIVEQYRFDISKYALKRAPLIRRVYDAVPSQLDKQNKRFRMDALKDGAYFERYEDDFAWLIDAGVVLPVYSVAEPKRPLARTAQRNKFKLYDSDTGLLLSQYEPSVTLAAVSNEAKTNFGAVYENAVAQELSCQVDSLYYYYSSKRGEVDFLLTQNTGCVLPVEVKSGKDYKLHMALNNFLECEEYEVNEAVVLSMANVSSEVKGEKTLWYLPLYMTFCIAESANGKMDSLHLPKIVF